MLAELGGTKIDRYASGLRPLDLLGLSLPRRIGWNLSERSYYPSTLHSHPTPFLKGIYVFIHVKDRLHHKEVRIINKYPPYQGAQLMKGRGEQVLYIVCSEL